MRVDDDVDLVLELTVKVRCKNVDDGTKALHTATVNASKVTNKREDAMVGGG